MIDALNPNKSALKKGSGIIVEPKINARGMPGRVILFGIIWYSMSIKVITSRDETKAK